MANFAFDKYSICFHDQSMVNLVNGARGVSFVEANKKLFETMVLPMQSGFETEVQLHRATVLKGLTSNPDQPAIIQRPGLDGQVWGVAIMIPKSWNNERRMNFVERAMNKVFGTK